MPSETRSYSSVSLIVVATVWLVSLFAFQVSEAWARTYRMEYTFETPASEVWAPIPRFWDGNGIVDVAIAEITPEPTDRYYDSGGTEIGYWKTTGGGNQTFKIIFEIEVSPIFHNISEYQQWPPYDTTTELYKKHTASVVWAQSDSPEIVATAQGIAGFETNRFKQARLFYYWIRSRSWASLGPTDYEDALSALQNQRAACGGMANLFVAFCRSVGIPARNVSSLSQVGSDQFTTGTLRSFADLETHVWAEFYLQDYGWVQCDATQPDMFARIPRERVITAKGNDILLGHNYSSNDYNNINGERSWFHLACTPGQENVSLTISSVGSEDGGGGGGGCLTGTAAYGSRR